MRRSLVPNEDEERRDLSLTDARIDIRSNDDGKETFIGHAAVFDSRTAIGNPLTWGFYEEIAPGAFTKTLSEGDARMLIDHDSYYVCSRVSAGTLYLAQDARGLAVESVMNDDLSYVRDLKVNLREKNITGMSFGFYVVKDDWTTEEVETNDGHTAEVEIRRITEIRLVEVSAVTFPAYDETDAGLRALRKRNDPDRLARVAKFRPDLIRNIEGLSLEGLPTVSNPADDTEPDGSTQEDERIDSDTAGTEGEPDDSTPRNAPANAEDVLRSLKSTYKRLSLL